MGRMLAVPALLVTIVIAAALRFPLWHAIIFTVIIVLLTLKTNFMTLLFRDLNGKDVSKSKFKVINGGRR